jgi:hypothetical protein
MEGRAEGEMKYRWQEMAGKSDKIIDQGERLRRVMILPARRENGLDIVLRESEVLAIK